VLADHYNLIQQGSTRQLAIRSADIDGVTQSRSVDTAASVSILFGGILYDLDSTRLAEIPEKVVPADAGAELRGNSWNYLKGTEKEVDQIGGIMTASALKPVVLKGSAATEEAFKSNGQVEEGTGSPRILHFATHGFFYPSPGTNDQKPKNREDASVFKFSDLPMMRSGLLMAGGNYAWKSGKPYRPGMEDGILTAYEIAQTDLSNTELVVLSACETGLGDIRGDEGVYGLQRAFKIAGARYLVMSLWRVPDAATQELMTAFYQKWLVQKMTIPEAFRAAQKEMRDKYQHPFFWAGFVLVE